MPEHHSPDFARGGNLVAAIAQDYKTGQVLMLGWMNPEAWKATLERGRAVYWSRSRNRLWEKGETSGNSQFVKEIFLDCDCDAVLLKVEQMGQGACHTGKKSCFFQRIR